MWFAHATLLFAAVGGAPGAAALRPWSAKAHHDARASPQFAPSAAPTPLSGLLLFEFLHRVIGVAERVSSIVLGLFFLPIVVVGTLGTMSLVLEDPIRLGHSIRYTVAFLFLTVVFFAVLFAELGLVDSISGRETRSF